MKTTIDKSKVMSRAHQIARCIKTYQRPLAKYAVLFADAMRQAWGEFRKALAKAAYEAEQLAIKAQIAAHRASMPADFNSDSWVAGIAADYANSPRGRYFGD